MNMKQYETFELRFGGEVLPDAWAQIDLTATFSCAQDGQDAMQPVIEQALAGLTVK